MNPSLFLTVILTLGGILLLLMLFMFGSAVRDTAAALVRIFLSGLAAAARVVANGVLEVGWYLVGVLAIVVTVGGLAAYHWFKPGGWDLTGIRPPVCTELLDRKGIVLDYLCPFDGVRIWRPLESVSTNLKMLVVMLEDDKFYEHGGLDIDEIWNALETDIEKKKIARGGSTITQQLAKNLFLTKEKSLLRKASEVPLAIRLEREFTKDQILELYLNTIEWGPGIYGVEAASRLYFDHESSQLTDEEAWLLALMIPNPKELNLWIAPRARRSLLNRAKHLSQRLYIEHRMDKDEARQALASFQDFLGSWAEKKPLAVLSGRRFPARWARNHDFALSEIVSIRRGAAGILKRYKQHPLRLNIDRELQEKLEALDPGAHAHDLSDVIAVMDGAAIRAMIPAYKASLLDEIQPIASAAGLTTQVFHARSIPPEALWP